MLFFAPIIAELRLRGHMVTVTARDFAQTLPLLRVKSIDHIAVGAHQGRSRVRKAYGLVSRVIRLLRIARRIRRATRLSTSSPTLCP